MILRQKIQKRLQILSLSILLLVLSEAHAQSEQSSDEPSAKVNVEAPATPSVPQSPTNFNNATPDQDAQDQLLQNGQGTGNFRQNGQGTGNFRQNGQGTGNFRQNGQGAGYFGNPSGLNFNLIRPKKVCVPQKFSCRTFAISQNSPQCSNEVWQRNCCDELSTQLGNWQVAGAVSSRARHEALHDLSLAGCGDNRSPFRQSQHQKTDLAWTYTEEIKSSEACTSSLRHTRTYKIESFCSAK